MSNSLPTLEDRFIGCLLGLAVGDALGAHVEGQTAQHIAARYRTAARLVANPPSGDLWYTDDTQMAIGVAETLVACGSIDDDMICRCFAANYVPQRGYGRGARLVLDTMLAGGDHRHVAANHLPGGSFGNGAAMRVAPVGLMYCHDHDTLWEQARRSALPTHTHPLGIEGAQILALAVGVASTADAFDRERFFTAFSERSLSLEYGGPLRRAAAIHDVKDLGMFGNGIAATDSVVTAIACFALTPNSYAETIGNAIMLGGDTDTIAAMAGAVSGAYLGRGAIPDHLVDRLEDQYQGRRYIEQLAVKLHAVHEAQLG